MIWNNRDSQSVDRSKTDLPVWGSFCQYPVTASACSRRISAVLITDYRTTEMHTCESKVIICKGHTLRLRK